MCQLLVLFCFSLLSHHLSDKRWYCLYRVRNNSARQMYQGANSSDFIYVSFIRRIFKSRLKS